jgi:TetR/AcrR family transcriptional regulator
MVKSDGSSTRDRIIAAAAQEFAARGFDGAKVDRIAMRARLNKAMLYYHFRSKAEVYRHILRAQFAAVATAVEGARAEGGTPDTQLRRFIETIARETIARPEFPAMWLRELAEGGRHLDDSVVTEMRRVIAALGAILDEGRRAGRFGPVNPFVMHMSLVAPLALFAVSRPVRERLKHLVPESIVAPDHAAVIEHVQAGALALLALRGAQAPEPVGPVRSRARQRSRSR